MGADLHHVADGDRVLHEDEDAGDDVLHQRLRAKAYGQAEHAGTGEQRGDIDAEFREQDQPAQGQQHDAEGVQ